MPSLIAFRFGDGGLVNSGRVRPMASAVSRRDVAIVIGPAKFKRDLMAQVPTFDAGLYPAAAEMALAVVRCEHGKTGFRAPMLSGAHAASSGEENVTPCAP